MSNPIRAKIVRLHGDGLTASEIAERLGCTPRTVQSHLEGKLRPGKHKRNIDREIVNKYSDKPAPTPVITLPAITLPPLDDDDSVVIRFAPRSRPVSTGAERWRQIHESMIRRGLVPGRDLVAEFH